MFVCLFFKTHFEEISCKFLDICYTLPISQTMCNPVVHRWGEVKVTVWYLMYFHTDCSGAVDPLSAPVRHFLLCASAGLLLLLYCLSGCGCSWDGGRLLPR